MLETYNNEAGQGACKKCLAGKYNDKLNSNDCKDCGLGKYNALKGQSSVENCILCIQGKYGDELGLSKETGCKGCGAGKYSTLEGQTSSISCVACEIGKYTEREASNECKVCSPEVQRWAKGQEEFLCPVYTYNDEPGRVSEMDCKRCENGKFNDKEGQSSCEEGVGLFVLFWILKGIGIVTALAFAYKMYTFIKLYKGGHLNKKTCHESVGC